VIARGLIRPRRDRRDQRHWNPKRGLPALVRVALSQTHPGLPFWHEQPNYTARPEKGSLLVPIPGQLEPVELVGRLELIKDLAAHHRFDELHSINRIASARSELVDDDDVVRPR
jgi:hypothetical protein